MCYEHTVVPSMRHKERSPSPVKFSTASASQVEGTGCSLLSKAPNHLSQKKELLAFFARKKYAFKTSPAEFAQNK